METGGLLFQKQPGKGIRNAVSRLHKSLPLRGWARAGTPLPHRLQKKSPSGREVARRSRDGGREVTAVPAGKG